MSQINEKATFTPEWDYTHLAKAYDKRAEYANECINWIIRESNLGQNAKIADIGAGTGKLTKRFLKEGFSVDAVEPNDEMRKIGVENTKSYTNISWHSGNSAHTNLKNETYNLISFGSSFNVADRMDALREVKRIGIENAWFCCMWNHRSFRDPLQEEVETTIRSFVPDYGYGLRRQDQSEFLENSDMFMQLYSGYFTFTHSTSTEDYLEAWASHGTLAQQAKDKFNAVLTAIEKLLENKKTIEVPFVTKCWLGKLK